MAGFSALSLLVLGWTLKDFEKGLRHAVAVVVMIAGTILAVDVAWPHHPQGQRTATQENDRTGIQEINSTTHSDDQLPGHAL